MTPRRDRPLKRCANPQCPHVGYWDGDRCPLHADPKPDKPATAIDRPTANPGGRHMTPSPALTRCGERSCPARGRWAEGGYCGWHQDQEAPRPPSDAEKRGEAADPITGHDIGDALEPHQFAALRRISDIDRPT